MEAAAEMKVEAQSLTEASNISAKVEGEVEINVMAAAQGTPLKNRIPDSSLLKTDLNPLEAAAQMKVLLLTTSLHNCSQSELTLTQWKMQQK